MKRGRQQSDWEQTSYLALLLINKSIHASKDNLVSFADVLPKQFHDRLSKPKSITISKEVHAEEMKSLKKLWRKSVRH